MEYVGYKLEFTTAVHFGDGRLEDAGCAVFADTVFSALCHEAINQGTIAELIDLVQNDRIRISDAFPYCNDSYYIPKPMIAIDADGDSVIKKKAKALEYVPVDGIDKYIKGELDIVCEAEKLSNMGKSEIRTKAAIYDEDTRPYSVGAFSFSSEWGLYIIVGYEDENALFILEDCLISLGYTGIGGKKSSGMGKYVLKPAKLPEVFTDRLTQKGDEGTYMNLSLGMCEDEQLASIIPESDYMLVKRSGFVYSSTYAEALVKKKDFYAFKSGSVFKSCYRGQLRDVSIQGNHPVYRYAMPIFMEI